MKWSQERNHARVVSDYADGLIARRRRIEDEAVQRQADLTDFDELLDLVRALNAIEILPSTGTGTQILQEVRRQSAKAQFEGAQQAMRRSLLRTLCRELWAARWAAGSVAAVLLVCAVLLVWRAQVRALLAVEVLQGSETAMAELLGGGGILVRDWAVTVVTRTGADNEERSVTTVREWVEGVHEPRIARFAYGQDGRLLWRFLLLPDADGMRPSLFYPADAPHRLRNVLVITPTTKEYREAVAGFPRSDQPLFDAFLKPKGGAGVVGERVFNRSVLGTWSVDDANEQRVVVSLDQATSADGAVHRIHYHEPARLWFERGVDGMLTAHVAQAESVRDISQEDRLTRRTATNCWLEDGRHVFTDWAVTRMQHLGRLPTEDPFRSDVPVGTRVIRVSAFEELTRMVPALRRIHGGLSRAIEIAPPPLQEPRSIDTERR